MVYVKRWFRYHNVCEEMVRLGHAVVYEGKVVEFGGVEKEIKDAEQHAKKHRVGLWKTEMESPLQYKKRLGT